MTNQPRLKNIFARSENREIAGEELTFFAPSADYAAKIEQAQFNLAKHLRNSKNDEMSLEAMKAGKAYTQICVEAVLQITAEEAKQLMVVAPSIGEEVNDFLGIGVGKKAELGEEAS